MQPCCVSQEKEQLKAQQRQVEEAREARRGKVHVTIDLLGRQVSALLCSPLLSAVSCPAQP